MYVPSGDSFPEKLVIFPGWYLESVTLLRTDDDTPETDFDIYVDDTSMRCISSAIEGAISHQYNVYASILQEYEISIGDRLRHRYLVRPIEA